MSKINRETMERERADAAYAVYWMMGQTRSLAGLLELQSTMGLRRALSTLKRWSIKFDWQRRILEANAQDQQRRERDYAQVVDQLNDRDAALGQGMKGLLIAAINRYRRQMVEDQLRRQGQSPQGVEVAPELDMDFRDMAALSKAAVAIERLARGQATSRVDVWVEIAATVVQEFAVIFMTVNKFATPEEREAEYIRLADEMVTRYYGEATKRGIAQIGVGVRE